MEFSNKLGDGASRDDLSTFLLLLSPFAPHLCEEAWETLGNVSFVCTQAWPEFDPVLAMGDSVTVVVQVNGKVRGNFESARGVDDEALKTQALELPNVHKFLDGTAPLRVIVVKGKLVNIVV